jgi:carbon storage regulator
MLAAQEEGCNMLVLTRKSNQSIMIGDDIEVSVLSVMGEKVRIGIQAPQKVPVFRKEIYLEIHREAGMAKPEQDGASEPAGDGEHDKAAGHTAEVDQSLHELGEGS